MRWEIRPLGPWIEPKTEPRRSAALFRLRWDDVLAHLAYEIDQLGGSLVVIQVDADPSDIRRDGMLRHHARVGFPGVRVSFDSHHGPLTYATDAYEQRYGSGLTSWQANVRAIGLGLEALRAVDRYGITRRGEQYVGWTALDSRPATMTREQAAEFIAHWAGWAGPDIPSSLLRNPEVAKAAYRDAAKRAHPDVTGDDGDTMARLNAARDLLTGGHHG